MNRMFRITRELTFCYGHRLLNHGGKCRHLHGHNGTVAITLEAETLDALGMVVDFGTLKRHVGSWIDETLDHRMILQETDPLVAILQAAGEPIVTMPEPPTAENLAKWIFDAVAERGFPVVEVVLWETPSCCAVYRR